MHREMTNVEVIVGQKRIQEGMVVKHDAMAML
jgi:hypothetical protein